MLTPMYIFIFQKLFLINVKKKKQVDIIKKFLKKNDNYKKKNIFLDENFEEDNESQVLDPEAIMLKPPLLYIRPKIDDIKEMMKNYLEIKKLL